METKNDYEVEPKRRYETALDKTWKEERDRLYNFTKKTGEKLKNIIYNHAKSLYDDGKIETIEEAERIVDGVYEDYLVKNKIDIIPTKIEQINSDVKKLIENRYIPLIREIDDIENGLKQSSKEDILEDINEYRKKSEGEK
jgi:hypothetical protein